MQSSVQFSSVTQSYPTLCNPMDCKHARLTPEACSNSCPSSWWCHRTISSCRPLLLASVFPSIEVFSNESVLHFRWPKYWNFSFSIHPSNEYSGLISFRTDWFHPLAVQGTLISLLQHHSSEHCFFGAQLSLWSICHKALIRQTSKKQSNVSAF